MEISQHSPHIKIRLMRIVDVLGISQRRDIPVRVAYVEPGRCNRSQTLGIGNCLQHIAVRRVILHIVPGHINRITGRNIRIIRLLELSGPGLFCDLLQRTCLNITNEPIAGTDLHPVILIFQYP